MKPRKQQTGTINVYSRLKDRPVYFLFNGVRRKLTVEEFCSRLAKKIIFDRFRLDFVYWKPRIEMVISDIGIILISPYKDLIVYRTFKKLQAL